MLPCAHFSFWLQGYNGQGASSKLPWMTLLGMWNLALEQNNVLTKSQRDKPANPTNRTNEQQGATSSELRAEEMDGEDQIRIE